MESKSSKPAERPQATGREDARRGSRRRGESNTSWGGTTTGSPGPLAKVGDLAETQAEEAVLPACRMTDVPN
eukprot:15467340-Alexandrium_andersonii.AAC.1